jgi:hypothetical protein
MKKIFLVAVTLLLTVGSLLSTASPSLACVEPCRWTGGGTIGTSADFPSGVRVTHGFELHCDLAEPNNLQVNWRGNHFHLTELTLAYCYYDEKWGGPEHPIVLCNEIDGWGIGKVNGTDGYKIFFCFTDGGEPGANDWARIRITDPGDSLVLFVEGYLIHGNHQAHPDNK